MKLRPKLALTALVAALPLVGGMTWARAAYELRAAQAALHDVVLARMDAGGREQCERSPETFPSPLARAERSSERASERGSERTLERGSERSSERTAPRAPGPREPLDAHEPSKPDKPPGGDTHRPPERLSDARQHGPGLPPVRASETSARYDLWAYDAQFHSSNARAPAFPDALQQLLASGDELAGREFKIEGRDVLEVAMRMPWSEGPCAIMLARRAYDRSGAALELLFGSALSCVVVLSAVLLAAGPIVERVRRLKEQVQGAAAGHYATAVEVSGNDEITALARAFNVAGAELHANVGTLEKRERTLRTFVENTTHDVMLPLTVLQGHLTALRRRVEAGRVPDRELVRDALEESHYLASLLQNLAVAAKLEADTPGLERHWIDLNALVERAIARHRTIAREKGVALDYAVPEPPLSVEGDVTLIEQAVSNVIHNALRYNHEGGHVAVVLETRAENGAQFVLRVIDDGPGIPDELRGRALERSFRTDAVRRRHPDGLGLGLSIAKDVADRHGFDLTLRRSQFGGLEIEFVGACMPCAEPASELEHAPVDAQQGA